MYYFANLAEAEADLEQFLPSRLNRYAYTTEYVQQFMDFVGNPQDIPKAIHIAGTSGKTSTAYYAAALLGQSGKKVGLLVSPHVELLNERVQINLEPLEERTFCDELAIFLDVVEGSGIVLTHAELLYSFAYWEFARQGVDYIVVEVGMGGTYDATNTISRPDKICAIADVGADHINVLGDNLTQITEHKAGIINTQNNVFCHRQNLEVMAVIRSVCDQRHANLYVLDTNIDLDLHFLPLFQRRNFSLAANVVEFAIRRDNDSRLSKAQLLVAAKTIIPSRMEIHRVGNKTVVTDGAHNVQKIHALRESVQDYFPGKSIAVMTAFMGGRGRKIEELTAELAALKPSHVIVTPLLSEEGRPARIAPEEVTAAFALAGIEATMILDQAEAYNTLLRCPEEVLLITGSLHLPTQLHKAIQR
ncbi:MAG TPA: Mur ligase family protein [Candidatus Saccharimonadales bacterium]